MNLIDENDKNILEKQWNETQWNEIIEETSAEISASVLEKLELENFLYKQIDKLPPIPKTIVDLEILKNSKEKDNQDLLDIVQWDAMIVANIFKVANSAMYGFSGKIKSMESAINLLWFNIVANIATITSINTLLKPNLIPYGINIDDFIMISSVQSRIIDKWSDPKIESIKRDLQLAAFLQEIWKILISIILIEKKLVPDFKKRISSWEEVNDVEEGIISKSSWEITAMIFTKWKFNPKIIEFIQYSDHPEKGKNEWKIWSAALKIVKTLSPVFKWWGTQRENLFNTTKSLELAELYWFERARLEKVIDYFE